MGLLYQSQNEYYNDARNFGNYQFTSLENIIDAFLIAYVGEGKTIDRVSRTDVAFHAQRAMQELSFDTFKSTKSQEIVLPPSNTMMLPHDYVNYTKMSWSDSSGIKRLLYPTSKTSNPFKVLQDTDGNPEFVGTIGSITDLKNADFSTILKPGIDWSRTSAYNGGITDFVGTEGGKLKFTSVAFNYQGNPTGRAYAVWQRIDTSLMDTLDIKADGEAAVYSTAIGGIIRFGISSSKGDMVTNLLKPAAVRSVNDQVSSTKTAGEVVGPNFLNTTDGTPGYIEWAGTTSTNEEVFNIDVSAHEEVYVMITYHVPFTSTAFNSSPSRDSFLSNISITFEGVAENLVEDGDSTTWTNYQTTTPSENTNQDYNYDTDQYDLNKGQRFGLDPQHAQTNGSFYIDNLRGLINFSSNISGKTVILDYISDSLGTDSEMQVHKFAEEALYKWITHAVLSTKANTPEHLVNRYKKERFAATRQAKLRLSNIKLEELTQILRGKSKHIKH